MGMSTARYPTTGGVRLAFGSIGAGFTGFIGAQSDVVFLSIYNSTNVEVTVSFDAGATDYLVMPANSTHVVDGGANGVHLAWVAVQVKYTSAAPVSGAIAATWLRRT